MQGGKSFLPLRSGKINKKGVLTVNIRKKIVAAAAAAVMLAGIAAQTVFALGWETDAAGRKYIQQDYTYVTNGWKWIDEYCYYFGPDGYVLTNCVTPDNFTVDQAGIWTVDGVRQKNKTAAVQLPRYQIAGKYFGFVPPLAWEKRYSWNMENDGSINFLDNAGRLLYSVRVVPVDGEDTLEEWENVKRIGKLVHYGATTHAVFRADRPGQAPDPAADPAAAAEYAWLKSYEEAMARSFYGVQAYQYVPAEEQ